MNASQHYRKVFIVTIHQIVLNRSCPINGQTIHQKMQTAVYERCEQKKAAIVSKMSEGVVPATIHIPGLVVIDLAGVLQNKPLPPQLTDWSRQSLTVFHNQSCYVLTK